VTQGQHQKARSLFMSMTALLLSASFVSSGAQSRAARPANVAPALTATDALPLTCAQAWAKAHRDYGRMLSVVVTLARVSLANRDLAFPNSRDAGIDVGKGIAEDCKADPDALLFAIVDKHVRRVAGNPG
jgi:YmgD protein